ncbi:MAG TPA: carbonic anhydrase [Acidimicrobiales bacterium]
MLDDLLEANLRYASGFALQGIPASAAKQFALVTCMDSRIEPLAMLGLRAGDAKILRNAGGRVTDDVLRSLLLATSLLGVKYIAVMQHTHCALAYRTDDDLRSDMLADRAVDLEGWEFHTMPDPDRALYHDVQTIRTCDALPPGIQVEGWRYDVKTGAITRVVPAGGG